MALQKKLVAYQGKTWEIKAQSLGSNGDPIDLTSYTFKFTVKRRPGLNEPVVFEVEDGTGITVTDSAAGKFSVEVSAAALAGVPAANYSYELVAYNGGKSKNLMVGTLEVRRGVVV